MADQFAPTLAEAATFTLDRIELLTTSNLVTVHNMLAPVCGKPIVNKFENRSVAIKRVDALARAARDKDAAEREARRAEAEAADLKHRGNGIVTLPPLPSEAVETKLAPPITVEAGAPTDAAKPAKPAKSVKAEARRAAKAANAAAQSRIDAAKAAPAKVNGHAAPAKGKAKNGLADLVRSLILANPTWTDAEVVADARRTMPPGVPVPGNAAKHYRRVMIVKGIVP